MLHRVLASLVCVLGAAAIALGIASATVWRPSDTLVAEATGAPGTTLLVTEPGVLTMAAPEVTVRATGDDVVVALGRTPDVEAWIGPDAHTVVTGLADWHVLETEAVPAEPEPPAEEPAEGAEEPAEGAEEPAEGAEEPAEGAEEPAEDAEAVEAAPDPGGSDLWWEEVSGATSAELQWAEQDGRWSILVATTGEDAGPPVVTLTWPQEVRTPWLLPGVFVGSMLLMVGLAWWALILVSGRRQSRRAALAPQPEPVGAAEPAVPLTRRQIREAASSPPRRHRPRTSDRDSITDRFPMLVPAPRRVREPVEDREAAADAPTTTAPARDSAGPPPATAEGAPPAPAPPTADADTSSSSEAAGPRRRRFALPVLGRRRGAREEPAAPDRRSRRGALREGSGPQGARGPDGAGGPATEHGPPVPRAGAPAASADAWRRTWGLNETVEGDVGTSDEGSDEKSDAPKGGGRR